MKQCQECGLNPATVHITRIVDNESQSFHLCEECARKQGIHIVIAGTATDMQCEVTPAVVEEDRACDVCSRTLFEFRNKGRLGCPSCYSAFQNEIDEILFQMHGSIEHKGKLYRVSRPRKAPAPSLSRLHCELESAIREENFERAAHLRDTIGRQKGAPGE
jgi:protein arginine kinase activator